MEIDFVDYDHKKHGKLALIEVDARKLTGGKRGTLPTVNTEKLIEASFN